MKSVKIKQVLMFDVTGENGVTETMKQIGEPWHGLIELRNNDLQVLIVELETGVVFKASLSLSERLGLL